MKVDEVINNVNHRAADIANAKAHEYLAQFDDHRANIVNPFGAGDRRRFSLQIISGLPELTEADRDQLRAYVAPSISQALKEDPTAFAMAITGYAKVGENFFDEVE